MWWMPHNDAIAVVVAAAAAANGNLDNVPLASTRATIHSWQVFGTLFQLNKAIAWSINWRFLMNLVSLSFAQPILTSLSVVFS